MRCAHCCNISCRSTVTRAFWRTTTCWCMPTRGVDRCVAFCGVYWLEVWGEGRLWSRAWEKLWGALFAHLNGCPFWQAGTPGYRPPEGNKAGRKHGFEFDYFSFGVSALELLDMEATRTVGGIVPSQAGVEVRAHRSVKQRYYEGASVVPACLPEAIAETVQLALLAMSAQPGDRLADVRKAPRGACGVSDAGTPLRMFGEKLRTAWRWSM